jgi:hypothetical protein
MWSSNIWCDGTWSVHCEAGRSLKLPCEAMSCSMDTMHSALATAARAKQGELWQLNHTASGALTRVGLAARSRLIHQAIGLKHEALRG